MTRKKEANEMVYIMQIHANKYFAAYDRNSDHMVTPDDLTNYRKVKGIIKPDDTLYIGTMPDSLEVQFLKKNFKREFRKDKKPNGLDVIRTDMIIDVVFEKKYCIKDETKKLYYRDKNGEYSEERGRTKLKMNQLNMRKKLYTEGFSLTIGGQKRDYVFYQRGAAKVKEGHCMFIDKKYIEKVNKWAFMGLDFSQDVQCDMTSLLAYRALTTSSAIGSIKIEPNEILLISDLAPEYKTFASITKYDESGEHICAKNEEYSTTQELFDGQSLLDVSKFTEEYEGKGCLLLRNKFFKSCAFNTNLQLWFKDNGIETVTDMFGQTHNARDIKLVTTPNSLKALKFAYKLTKNKRPEDNKILTSSQKLKMYNHWSKNIDSNFAIVKFEKPSRFESKKDCVKNQLSYQMINSLPLSKEQIKILCDETVANIKAMRDDFETFKKYLNDTSGIYGSSISLAKLCNINPDVQYTQIYKDHKNEIIKSLKNKAKKGKIIVTADYGTMVSNPIEMLYHTIAQPITDDIQVLEPYEIYTPLYEDGVELAGFRSPHIASGNVCLFKNCHNNTIAKYMNLTDNIVVMTAYKNDVMARLQGADTDSDTVLLVNNEIIIQAAKECREFLTPINDIKGKSEYPAFNMSVLAVNDTSIAKNLIGQICNTGQLLNCYYWDMKSKGASEDELEAIYNDISMLSSLSQIEIDRAKKTFPLEVKTELKLIKENSIINKMELTSQKAFISQTVKDLLSQYDRDFNNGKIEAPELKEKREKILMTEPYQVPVKSRLMQQVSYSKNCMYEKMDAPMDDVIDVIENMPRANRSKKLYLIDLLAERPEGEIDRKMSKFIITIASEVRCIQKSDNKTRDKAIIIYDYKGNIFNAGVMKIRRHELKPATMYAMMHWAYGKEAGHLKCKDELKDVRKTLMDLLAAAYPEMFYSMFTKK